MLPVLRRRNSFPAGFGFGNEFDRFFNVALGGPSLSGWSPAIDVAESADEFVLSAELPGLTSDDVEITVENGTLAISGEKRDARENTEDESGRHVVERRYGKFVRNFSLPRAVDGTKVAASVENGLLTVRLPKSSAAKARRIKIG